ncbi:hypothetical protein V6N12_073224 [Hibiscus sabdariffa]|uniref:Uncharacterized protein n=1 Tax=Hibiscus sabdariffa TaxID=183260 RepID=A0ABR2B7H5_9ROSI
MKQLTGQELGLVERAQRLASEGNRMAVNGCCGREVEEEEKGTSSISNNNDNDNACLRNGIRNNIAMFDDPCVLTSRPGKKKYINNEGGVFPFGNCRKGKPPRCFPIQTKQNLQEINATFMSVK